MVSKDKSGAAPGADAATPGADRVAVALDGLASAVRDAYWHLGTGSAATSMGAIECLAVSVKEAGEAIGRGLADVAEAIREHGQ
jgi:hypothetical protein